MKIRCFNKRPSNVHEIRQLPTLAQLHRQIEERYAGISNPEIYPSLPFHGFGGEGQYADLLDPLDKYSNDCDSSSFIVNRLDSRKHPGRFVCALVPNLREVKVLYRGQRAYHPRCVPSMFRDPEKAYFAESVVLSTEFGMTLERHPLYKLLYNGFELGGIPIILDMDPYGLAQHYGFSPRVIDFTSDFNVAAFFAVTRSSKNGCHKPHTVKDTYGVLYYLPLERHNFAFTNGWLGERNRISTIGLQIFPRSGLQRGFLYNCGIDSLPDLHDNHRFCMAYFKHTRETSEHYFKKYAGGDALFPPDLASLIAARIRNSGEISIDTFRDNLQNNPHNTERQILDCLEENGIKVNPNLHPHLEPEELQHYHADIKNGMWENFCRKIEFPFRDKTLKRRLEEELLRLPSNPAYSPYFH